MIDQLFSLNNKTALITGASSGIGQQQAKALAMAGAQVVLLGRRESELQACAESIASFGTAHVLAADLQNRENISDIATQAQSFTGHIDILVNAAGVNFREPYGQITPESWDQTININLSVPFFLARELVSGMEKRGGGRIINIASLQSERAFADSMPYGASKGGVAQLTRAMAEAWSAKGINSNAIAPGFFPTGLTAPVFEKPELLNKLSSQTAIGRNGELEDLDGVTVFLAAQASAYITGQIIYVDGGFTAK